MNLTVLKWFENTVMKYGEKVMFIIYFLWQNITVIGKNIPGQEQKIKDILSIKNRGYRNCERLVVMYTS